MFIQRMKALPIRLTSSRHSAPWRRRYGYGISRTVAEKSNGMVQLKEATLYTAFRRMEENGYIRSYWGDEETGARRRYYSLTEPGRVKLEDDREAWEETRHVIDTLIG